MAANHGICVFLFSPFTSTLLYVPPFLLTLPPPTKHFLQIYPLFFPSFLSFRISLPPLRVSFHVLLSTTSRADLHQTATARYLYLSLCSFLSLANGVGVGGCPCFRRLLIYYPPFHFFFLNLPIEQIHADCMHLQFPFFASSVSGGLIVFFACLSRRHF